MKSTRHLALRRESLTELTPDELASAGGGQAPTLQQGCSYDDVTVVVKNTMLRLTLHPHCSWSCI